MEHDVVLSAVSVSFPNFLDKSDFSHFEVKTQFRDADVIFGGHFILGAHVDRHISALPIYVQEFRAYCEIVNYTYVIFDTTKDSRTYR
jgi:hypothetical protein